MDKDVQNYLGNLLPTQPLFDARRVIGSILLIDLGEPIDGQFQTSFTIYMSDWSLYHKNEVILDCEETNEEIYVEVLKNLCGKRITKLEEKKNSDEIHILFDDEYHFILKSNLKAYDEEDDLFYINQKNRPSLGYNAKQGFYLEKQLNN